MKKLICTAVLLLLLTLPVFAADITSADDLLTLMNTSDMWSGEYILTADIDLSKATNELTQTPIGTSSTPFTGKFDGGGYEISGIDLSGETHVALFGCVKNAEIKNLTVSGTVTANGNYAGGLIGYASGTLTVEKCHNQCTVTGKEYVGGIAGYLWGADTSTTEITMSVIECMNSGVITALTDDRSDAGGIAGIAWYVGAIRDCYNTGLVTSANIVPARPYLGGIVGRAHMYAKITNCYNDVAPVSQATDTTYVRGIVGYPNAKNASNCYFKDGLGMSDITCGSAYSKDNFAALNANDVWYNEESPRLAYFDDVTIEEVTLDSEIGTADELLILMNYSTFWEGDYTLTADIDLSKATNGLTQTPIGTSSTPFTGNFDGGGYEISGIALSGETHVALFGCVKNAEIKNLTVSGTVVASGNYAGGLIGYASGTLAVEKCHNKCTVTGKEYIGGIAGYLWGADTSTTEITMSVIECMNSGVITALAEDRSDAGGIAGIAWNVGTIRNCYNEGLVTTLDVDPEYAYVGGILGRTHLYAQVECCYNAVAPVSKASDTTYVRGIVGYPPTKHVTNCFYKDGLGMNDPSCGTAYSEEHFVALNVYNAWVDKNQPKLAAFYECTHSELAYRTITPSTCITNGSATAYCDTCMKEFEIVELEPNETAHTAYRFAYISESGEYAYICNGCETALDDVDSDCRVIPTFISADNDGKVTLKLNIHTDSPVVAVGFAVTAPGGASLVNVTSDVTEESGFAFAGASEYTSRYKMSIISNTATEKTLDAFVTLIYEIEKAAENEKGLFEASVLEAYNETSAIEFTAADAEFTYIEKVKGDVNDDGVISVSDALLLLMAFLNGEAVENTDMNNDGVLNLIDVLRVLKLIAQ